MYSGTLNYTERGEGLPIVLIHGFPFDRRIWNEQMEGVSSVGRVIALDLPGFGQSAEFPRGMEPRMEDYAQAIADFVRDRDLGQIILVGHSMGGYVAMAFARRYSEMLAGMVLVATRVGADRKAARQNRMALADDVRSRGAMAVVVSMLSKLFAAGNVGRDPGLSERLREIMMEQSSEGIIAGLHAMASRPNSGGVIKSLQIPMLVIAGAQDAIIRERAVRAISRSAQSSTFVSVPDAGHMPMMENPAMFNEALRVFRCGLPHMYKPPGCP